MDIIKKLAEELKLREEQVERTVELIDEGNTIPFIARYRKEVTGSLDDEVLRKLEDRLTYLRNIEKRKEEVKNLIAEQGKLADELAAQIDNAVTITEVDDIYRPFRPHRKTRASVARERGLGELAELIMSQLDKYEPSLIEAAEAYVSEEKGVESAEAALKGACDIIAEDVSDNAEYRKTVRRITFDFGLLSSKAAKDEDSVYSQYYEYSESIKKMPHHRILAVNRGENEGFLKVSITVEKDMILNYLLSEVITNQSSPAYKYIYEAVIDSYDRLIAPSIEREIRNDMTDAAGEGAIALFSEIFATCLCRRPLRARPCLDLTPDISTAVKRLSSTRRERCLTPRLFIPRRTPSPE